MQKQETEDRQITTRILRSLYEDITEFVEASTRYANEADFIRDAVREKLQKEQRD